MFWWVHIDFKFALFYKIILDHFNGMNMYDYGYSDHYWLSEIRGSSTLL